MNTILSIETKDELGFDDVHDYSHNLYKTKYASNKCQLCWGVGELSFTHPVKAIVLCNCVVRKLPKLESGIVYNRTKIYGYLR